MAVKTLFGTLPGIALSLVLGLAWLSPVQAQTEAPRPATLLRIMLPTEGATGLAPGAEMEVQGVRIGRARRFAIAPDERLYAEIEVDEALRDLVRRDSRATIRSRLTGASYFDVSRGSGPRLDWSTAAIDARADRTASDATAALTEDIRQRAIPMLADFQRAGAVMARAMERIDRGEGILGRMLSGDASGEQAAELMAEARALFDAVGRILATLERSAGNAERLTASVAAPQGVPALLRRADAMLANLQAMTRDLSRATPRATGIVRNAEEASGTLAPMLLQLQSTTRELEALLAQVRGMWLLGGGGPLPEQGRLPAERIRP